MRIIRPLLALFLFFPLSYSFALQLIEVFRSFDLHTQTWFWGAAAGMLIFSLIFIRQSSFVAILKHELSHNLFAILTFHKPMALHVTAGKGGEFHYSGKTNLFMLLAPYFFPLISAVIMLISLFDIQAHNLFFALLGISVGFDLSTSWKDIHLGQPDLRHYGFFFSVSFILLLALIFYGMIIAFVTGGYSGSGSYFVEGFRHAFERVRLLFSWINF